MIIFFPLMSGIIIGSSISILICGIMLNKSNNIGDDSSDRTALSTNGVIFTQKLNHVEEDTVVYPYYPGCKFKIKGR